MVLAVAVLLVSGGVLAFTWVGYPALIGLLALRRRARPPCRGALPRVSVVIATRDAPPVISRRVRNILRSSYPRDLIDVVVALDRVVGESSGEYHGVLGQGGRVVLGTGGDGKAAALNSGMEAVSGQVVVFADSWQRFDRQTISQLVAPLTDPRFGMSTGNLFLRPGESGLATRIYWEWEKWLREREAHIHSPVGATGSVSAIRKDLWEPLPEGLILDDVYTPMRLVMNGLRVAFVPGARAFELRRPSVDQEHRRKVRTQTGVLQLCVLVPGLLNPMRNPLFVQFLCHKLLRLITPYALLAGIASSLVLAWTLWPQETRIAIGGLVVPVVLVAVGWPAPFARFQALMLEFATVQAAVARAAWYGLRGRWDVWG